MSGVRLDPWDEHNRALVERVRPPAWVNPEPAARYNLVVLGGGTAGLVAAAGAGALGARVALVERHLLGGDCLNYGCVPSKTLVRAGRAAYDVRAAADYGIRVPAGVAVDFAATMARVRRVRAEIGRHDAAARLSGEYGVDVFIGDARFTGPATIEAAGRTLRFARALIATGARALRPSIPGLDAAGFLTNETVFSLTALPPRLAVIGGGPVGCELAQAFARLGSRVVVLEAAARLLPRDEEDAARVVRASLERDGVDVVTGCSIGEVEAVPGGKRLTVASAGTPRRVDVDEILVGAGRAPNVEGLGLESAGVAWDAAGVRVDDRLRTANRRVYAAGDVCLRQKFTHAADASARIALRNALFAGRRRLSALTIPWCTYTDPEVAGVGLTAEAARERGLPAAAYTVALADVDRAVTDGETAGFVRLVAHRRTGRLLGATVVARHAGEMIGEVAVALAGGVGLARLSEVIHAYPTQAEAFRRAADAFQRSRLTPAVAAALRGWLALGRRG
jgi:pyruvate/2-oxoglutarate dehydrogenase complex dihydrolipoamide dehydrogenase (E3) component